VAGFCGHGDDTVCSGTMELGSSLFVCLFVCIMTVNHKASKI
jgi:hypothetical protein